jgi:hypothetical protein
VDVTGFESGSGGVYNVGYQLAKKNFVDKYNLTYPVLIENDNDTVSTMLGMKGSVPTNVIINGVVNDPLYDQWEIIYKSTGFPLTAENQTAYLNEYKENLNKISITNDPILRLSTNQNLFFPSDRMNASIRVKYYGVPASSDLYVALLAFGNLFFFPTWTSDVQSTPFELATGFDRTIKILESIPISKDIPEATYSLLSVTAARGTYNPTSNISKLDFSVSHQIKGSMKTYFKDNPVYRDPETQKWIFTIYLENTGDYDISMDEFTMETFDADGNSLGAQSYIDNFHIWFKLLGRILPAGEIAEANLNADFPSMERAGVELYFKGKDTNNFDVETRSERLLLLIAN